MHELQRIISRSDKLLKTFFPFNVPNVLFAIFSILTCAISGLHLVFYVKLWSVLAFD